MSPLVKSLPSFSTVLGLLLVVGCGSSTAVHPEGGPPATVDAQVEQRDGDGDTLPVVCDSLHAPPLTKCGATCMSTIDDVQNCGGCGIACWAPGSDSSCVDGKCTFTCRSGFGDCNALPGCETDFNADDGNCGACGNSCARFANTVSSCTAGSCSMPVCKTGFGNCANTSLDCKTNLQTDPLNCGSCGQTCLGGGCAGGQCCSWKVGHSCVSTDAQTGTSNCAGDCVLPGGTVVQAGHDVGPDGLRRGAFRILVLSTTLEYRESAIPTGLQMLTDLGSTSDADLESIGAPAGSQWTVDAPDADLSKGAGYYTDALSAFTSDNLKNYELVFSNNPSGAVFTNSPNGTAAKAAFESFMMNGGAWAGQHLATDFENSGKWPWFQDQIDGGFFVQQDGDGSPGVVTWEPNALTHPILRGLSSPWNVTDEWLIMNRDIEAVPGFQVLAKVTVLGSQIDRNPRPAIWIHELAGGGRAFYTIRGDNKTVYAEPAFRKLILQGILWAVHRLQ
jgi:type 1 glutamine amidotransferase